MSLLYHLVVRRFVFHTFDNNDYYVIKQEFIEVLLCVDTGSSHQYDQSPAMKIMQVPSHKFVYVFLKNTDNKKGNTKLKKKNQILINAKNEINSLM